MPAAKGRRQPVVDEDLDRLLEDAEETVAETAR
jgi:hypothetical protein